MKRLLGTVGLAGVTVFVALTSDAAAESARGIYLEARTCQVYTGPCFANAEAGLAGKNAILAWSFDEGSFEGVELSGLKVVLVIDAADTLGFGGLDAARSVRSVILVDHHASPRQREALVQFVRAQSNHSSLDVRRIDSVPIEMSLDTQELSGRLQAGKIARLVTRKARPGDCICSNEVAYYPPLARVAQFAPGVTIDGQFTGRGLGTRWSIPDTRSAYMATFSL
jgi:hypothetical protein